MNLGLAEVVWESELTPQALAGAIDRAWRARPVCRPDFAMDGDVRTADLVSALAAAPAPDLTVPSEIVR